MDMGDKQLCVYVPLETETLEQYFERYTNEELQNIIIHPELSKEFCSKIIEKCKQDFSETEDQFQNLWNQIKNYDRDSYESFRYYVKILAPARQNLIKSLEKAANQIEKCAKYASISRLVFSAADVVGTVGGLCKKNSSFPFSDYAFRVGSTCGFLSSFSTATELYCSERVIKNILTQIQNDQTLLTPIQTWFQQTNTLQFTVRNIFPCDSMIDSVQDFINVAQNDLSAIDFLRVVFRRVIEINIEHLRNGNWVKNLITLISNSDLKNVCHWLILQYNPAAFDAARVMLQLQYSPAHFSFFQYLPALSPKDQNLWSVPVWGRISLNFGTMLHSIVTLRKSEKSHLTSEIRILKDKLEAQMHDLERIINYCDTRRSQLFSY